MIIGNGSIANVLKDNNDLVFFASGVSNSACVDEMNMKENLIFLKQFQKINI
jgi:hypothetical protein